MDIQDQSKTTIPSGHESHGVHLCHRCGWPFPNPNPSARHRRSHKKICGTIEGYTKLIDSGVVSDDEHHSEEDQEKTPSPKIEEKRSIKGSGGVRSIRSEDDLYSDAVTEFSDTGISPGVEDRFVDSRSKTLDRDIFLSFKDEEDAGTTHLLDSSVELSKADTSLKVIETLDTHAKDAEKIEETEVTTAYASTEAKIKLLETDDKPLDHLVKDEVVKSTPGQSDGSQPHQAESIDLVEASTYSAKDVNGQGDTLEVSDKKEHGKDGVYVLSVPSDIPIVDHSEALLEDFKDHKAIHTNVPAIGDNDTAGEISSSAAASSMVDSFEVKAGEDKIQETRTSEIDECSVELESTNPEHTKSNFVPSVPTVVTVEAKVAESRGSEMSKTAPESVDNLIDAKHSSTTGFHGQDDENEQKLTDKLSDVALGERSKAGVAEEKNEEIKHKKLESHHEHAAEVVKEPEIDHNVLVLTEKEDLGAHISDNYSNECSQEIVKELEIDHNGSLLTKEEDLGTPNSESHSKTHTQEVVKEPEIDQSGSVLIGKEDLGAPNPENSSKENTQEVVKEPEIDHSRSVLIEKEDLGVLSLEDSSKKHTQEVVIEPEIAHSGTVLSKKEDLGTSNLENYSKEHTLEVVKEPKIDQSDSVLTEREDLGAHLEDCSKDRTQEVVKEPEIDNDSKAAAEIVDAVSKDSGDVNMSKSSSGKIILKEAEQSPKDLGCTQIRNRNKNASGVSEPVVEEGNSELMTNQDSGVDMSADSSSHNSLEGHWGSVSVLSIASIDTETSHSVDKSKVNSEKLIAVDSHSGKSDVFDTPFLTEPKGEVVEQKTAATSSETKAMQNTQQQPTSEASLAGGFPALANVSNESEGRKRNEEVIAKVTNWTTGKHSAPLKNLLGEAKSPNPKLSTVIQKDEAAEESNGNVAVTEKSALLSEAPTVNQDMSPPKYIGDGKKVKRRASWMPFVCCSSVNVGN